MNIAFTGAYGVGKTKTAQELVSMINSRSDATKVHLLIPDPLKQIEKTFSIDWRACIKEDPLGLSLLIKSAIVVLHSQNTMFSNCVFDSTPLETLAYLQYMWSIGIEKLTYPSLIRSPSIINYTIERLHDLLVEMCDRCLSETYYDFVFFLRPDKYEDTLQEFVDKYIYENASRLKKESNRVIITESFLDTEKIFETIAQSGLLDEKEEIQPNVDLMQLYKKFTKNQEELDDMVKELEDQQGVNKDETK